MTSAWEGRLVRLRAPEPSDWSIYAKWTRDTDTNRLSDHVYPPVSGASLKRQYEAASVEATADDRMLLVIETLAGEHVGDIATYECDRRNGTLKYGIAVREEQRGKGYAREALVLLLRYYFSELRYQKATATVYAFNGPSQRLHESLGFLAEGRLRHQIYINGQFHDVLVYGVTAEEFEDKHGNGDWGSACGN